MSQRAIAEGLFSWPSDNPRLLGSRCQQCGIVNFPSQNSCPACCSEDVKIDELAKQGTLWSWTIQRFMPKTPYNSGETKETFRPYGVGYVELPAGVCVEGRLTENDPNKLKIGMPMEVVFDVFRKDEDEDVINFYFKPIGE